MNVKKSEKDTEKFLIMSTKQWTDKCYGKNIGDSVKARTGICIEIYCYIVIFL